MVAASVGKKQIGRTALIFVVLVVVVLIAFYVVGKLRDKSEAGEDIPGDTAEQRENYLASLGIEVDPTSAVAEVKVPEEFDERFTDYNAMLQTTGFDLTALKGETVKKCSYTVLNRSDLGSNVSAVLLVYKGNIVAGHLLDVSTGALYPLFEAQTDAVQETILPTEQPEAQTGQTVEQPIEEETQETISQDAYPID